VKLDAKVTCVLEFDHAAYGLRQRVYTLWEVLVHAKVGGCRRRKSTDVGRCCW
jgi:hypothetical protein